MSILNTFESNEFDNFLNIENDFTSLSTSPATNTIPSASNSTTLASSQPAFTGPSYQYDSHRQQTGLPMGALANTFAVNQASGLHYRPSNNMGFVMPTETLNIPLSNLEDFDIGRSQIDMSDMDFDPESPSDLASIYHQTGTPRVKSEPSTQSTPIQRIYPGMHSQQAAEAKAKQQEILRQQQHHQKQIPGQLPLPTEAPKVVKDPHVEESISRLLSRMRQSSTSSVDESTPVPGTGMSNVPRLKKDEDDMDEDERLLASEEGKKLSSKERRQLRNKVSARAFRSRRKEYIGQLEGEVAAKVQEANDLREQNRQLMEENNRLTDLTRMLLSSQAFSGFLQELSNSGMTMSNASNTTQPQPQLQTRKDVSVHEASRQLQSQNQHQVGMTLIPETNIDLSDFSGSWTVPLPSNDYHVFSVTAIPQPPVLDLDSLSDKKAAHMVSPKSLLKAEGPEVSSLPPPIEPATHAQSDDGQNVNESDEDIMDLYSTATSTSNSMVESARSLVESLHKPETIPSPIATIVDVNNETEAELSSRLQQMCDALEECAARIHNLTS